MPIIPFRCEGNCRDGDRQQPHQISDLLGNIAFTFFSMMVLILFPPCHPLLAIKPWNLLQQYHFHSLLQPWKLLCHLEQLVNVFAICPHSVTFTFSVGDLIDSSLYDDPVKLFFFIYLHCNISYVYLFLAYNLHHWSLWRSTFQASHPPCFFSPSLPDQAPGWWGRCQSSRSTPFLLFPWKVNGLLERNGKRCSHRDWWDSAVTTTHSPSWKEEPPRSHSTKLPWLQNPVSFFHTFLLLLWSLRTFWLHCLLWQLVCCPLPRDSPPATRKLY